MKNFTFYNPTKIIFGKDTVKQIGEELKKDNIKKVLLHYGRSAIKKNGVYDTVVKSLKENDVEYVEVSGVVPNPRLSKVKEGIEVAKKEKVEAILAVGGGSVIDSAKAIAGGYYNGEDKVWEVYSTKKRFKKALPIYTVLTLSATGSEMNGNSVITNEETKQKFATSGTVLYPRVSIIDPAVQMSLPKSQTINGAVDAISHVMEFYFDPVEGNETQLQIAEGIIRSVMKSTEILLDNSKDYDARANLAWSATLALNGLLATGSNGGDWASHMLEHSVSALFDIAHGTGLAIIFPAWMKYVYNCDVEKFDRFAKNIFNIDTGNPATDARLGIEALIDWLKKIGQPVSLSEVDIDESNINDLVDNAMQVKNIGSLKNLDREDIEKIFRLAL